MNSLRSNTKLQYSILFSKLGGVLDVLYEINSFVLYCLLECLSEFGYHKCVPKMPILNGSLNWVSISQAIFSLLTTIRNRQKQIWSSKLQNYHLTWQLWSPILSKITIRIWQNHHLNFTSKWYGKKYGHKCKM